MSIISSLENTSPLQSLLRLGSADQPATIGEDPIIAQGSRSGQLSEFAREQQKLAAYLKDRDARFQLEHPEGPIDGTVAVAMRVGPDGFSPFVTADQQQTIDEITAKYAGRHDFADLYAELAQHGVHPDQISASAKWFIGQNGRVRDSGGAPIDHHWLDVTV